MARLLQRMLLLLATAQAHPHTDCLPCAHGTKYPSHDDCTHFYYCHNGDAWILKPCPTNEAFDVREMACANKAKSRCHSDVMTSINCSTSVEGSSEMKVSDERSTVKVTVDSRGTESGILHNDFRFKGEFSPAQVLVVIIISAAIAVAVVIYIKANISRCNVGNYVNICFCGVHEVDPLGPKGDFETDTPQQTPITQSRRDSLTIANESAAGVTSATLKSENKKHSPTTLGTSIVADMPTGEYNSKRSSGDETTINKDWERRGRCTADKTEMAINMMPTDNSGSTVIPGPTARNNKASVADTINNNIINQLQTPTTQMTKILPAPPRAANKNLHKCREEHETISRSSSGCSITEDITYVM